MTKILLFTTSLVTLIKMKKISFHRKTTILRVSILLLRLAIKVTIDLSIRVFTRIRSILCKIFQKIHTQVWIKEALLKNPTWMKTKAVIRKIVVFLVLHNIRLCHHRGQFLHIRLVSQVNKISLFIEMTQFIRFLHTIKPILRIWAVFQTETLQVCIQAIFQTMEFTTCILR